MNKMKRYVLVLALVVVGLICIISPTLTGYDAINGKAAGTVKDALTENAKTFIVVSGLKAGLAIIEGSTAGAVLINIEVGDLVQPSYDFVDQVWTFLLYGLLILSLYEFVLEFGLLGFGVRILGVGLLLWGFTFLFPDRQDGKGLPTGIPAVIRQRLPAAARFLVAVGLLLAYLVPLTLIATYGMRGYITEPVKIRQAEQIATLEQELDQLKEEFLLIKEELSFMRPMQSADRAKRRVRAIAVSLYNTFNNSLHIFLYYVVIIFIEVLVFPLLTAFVLYKLGQLAIGRFSTRTPAAGGPRLPAPPPDTDGAVQT